MLVKITMTTSGITTIRIAFMKIWPKGADPSASAKSKAFPVAAAASPTISPATSPSAIARCSMRCPPKTGPAAATA